MESLGFDRFLYHNYWPSTGHIFIGWCSFQPLLKWSIGCFLWLEMYI